MSLSLKNFCDTCGAANREQARFCCVCGSSLNGKVTSQTLTGLLPRVLLKGRYSILSQTGRGGFGAVYKAQDIQSRNRLVAVKEMNQENIDPKERATAIEIFHREAKLLAELAHPNLPRIYEQFSESDRLYLVMDFIAGETLENHLQDLAAPRRVPEKSIDGSNDCLEYGSEQEGSHGRDESGPSSERLKPGDPEQLFLPVEQTLDIALQICSVLEYLHSRQPPIVFRDLKPGNVMLTPTGHIYLIDFGIARHFRPGQQYDLVAHGSLGYAPPEQYGKSQTTTRSDIYSLGATLHQLLTGDDPSESPFHFEPLHFSDPALFGLDTLVMSMLSVEVEKRPETISIVHQELLRIMEQYKKAQEMAAAEKERQDKTIVSRMRALSAKILAIFQR